MLDEFPCIRLSWNWCWSSCSFYGGANSGARRAVLFLVGRSLDCRICSVSGGADPGARGAVLWSRSCSCRNCSVSVGANPIAGEDFKTYSFFGGDDLAVLLEDMFCVRWSWSCG